MITLGELLDLIDNNRESEEIVNIMDGCNGQVEIKGMVKSKLWNSLESIHVNSIQASGDELNVWLEKEEEE